MIRVVLRSCDNLLNTEFLRLRYEAAKWKEENKDYDPNDETVTVRVCHTDKYNPLPDHLK